MKIIPLTQGKRVIVDNEDHLFLNQYKWYAKKGYRTYYAARSTRKSKPFTIWMHRVIMNTKHDQEIDHINGNGLDNRKVNLRICNRQQNMQNSRKRGKFSSLHKGVSWNPTSKRWAATIGYNYKLLFISNHKTEKEAAKAYNKKAQKLYGKFACANKEIK